MKHQLITAQGLAIALAISLCAFATQSYSQTQPQIPARKPQVKLSGTTKDDKGKSIEFCNIVLKSTKDTTFVRGTISDMDGKFSISVPAGQYNVSVGLMGYTTFSKTITMESNTDMGTVTLAEDAKMLGEVEITAKLIEREADKFVMNNVGKSAMAIGKSSLEILDIAPGVFVDKDGAISINGKSDTKIMINDRMTRMTGEQLAAYLRNIKAEDILKIEIIANPGAEYDSSSSGGIIHYTIRRSALEGYNGSAGISYRQGEYSSISPSANINYRNAKLTLYGSFYGSWSKSGGTSYSESVFKEQGNRRDSKSFSKSNYDNKGVNIGAIYDITDRQSVGFEADIFGFGGDTKGLSDMYMNEGAVKKHVPSINNSDNSYDFNTFSLNYRIKTDSLGSQFKVLFDWTQRKSDRDSDYDSKYMIFDPDTEDYTILERYNIYHQGGSSNNNNYSVSADYKHMFTKKTVLNVGVKYNKMDVKDSSNYRRLEEGAWVKDPARQDFYKYKEDLGAVYAKFSSSIKNFNYTLGLRMETYRMDGYSVTLDKEYIYSSTDFFPSVYVSYNLNKQKGHTVGASYNRRIRRPYYSQLNPNIIQYGDFDISVGRPDIKPSFINNFELSSTIKYKYSFAFGYNNYNGTYENVTVPNPEKPNSTIQTMAEIDRVHSLYISVFLPLKLTKWWNANLNMNGSWRTYNVLDMHREALSGYFFGNMMFTLPKDWTIQIRGNAYSFGSQGNSKGSTMWRMSSGITKRMLKDKQLSLSFDVDDIFNSSGNYNYTSETPEFFQSFRSDRNNTAFGLSLRYSFSHGKKIQVGKVESGNSEDRGRL